MLRSAVEPWRLDARERFIEHTVSASAPVPSGLLWPSNDAAAAEAVVAAALTIARRLAADDDAETDAEAGGDTLPSPSCTRSLTEADADSGTAENETEPAGNDTAEWADDESSAAWGGAPVDDDVEADVEEEREENG